MQAHPMQINKVIQWPGDSASQMLNSGNYSGSQMLDMLDEQVRCLK